MKISNKKAHFEYKLEQDKFEAGISLSGGEAKAVRCGHADLSRSVARVVGGEIFLINANIPIIGAKNYTATRMRKLLLHKNEIVSVSTKMKQFKLTLVPVSIYNKGRLIKLGLALGRPRHKFEKKETIKRKDIEREINRELKN